MFYKVLPYHPIGSPYRLPLPPPLQPYLFVKLPANSNVKINYKKPVKLNTSYITIIRKQAYHYYPLIVTSRWTHAVKK